MTQKSIVQEINANPNAGWQAAMNSRFENYTVRPLKSDFNHSDLLLTAQRGFLCINISLSVNDLLSCCGFMCGDGCDGGYPIRAWQYFVQNGIVTDEVTNYNACDPYFDDIGCAHPGCEPLYPTPQCEKKCKAKNLLWDQSKHFGVNAYIVNSDPKDIMTEVYTNGPVEVDFTDFAHYKSGVYKHVTGDAIGGHAVKLIGWGTSDEGEDYWVCS
ncbi:hypothetical protein B296_00034611 [Ensete ventricosum]|uniref:Peptidase C1A papain C-terminal domain-containing protein n=1 Tax=Ensete ventricosum TaxID=4639 RepID=A0A427A802_ENSVE|nr:hypothetical protein B296_00034611 [Ensete ventricosum]